MGRSPLFLRLVLSKKIRGAESSGPFYANYFAPVYTGNICIQGTRALGSLLIATSDSFSIGVKVV